MSPQYKHERERLAAEAAIDNAARITKAEEAIARLQAAIDRMDKALQKSDEQTKWWRK